MAVGCVPSTAVVVSPDQAFCPSMLHMPPAMHAPLTCTCPSCHTCTLPSMPPTMHAPLPCIHPLAMHDPLCPVHAPFAMHYPPFARWCMPPPPVDRMTDTCENITFQQLLINGQVNIKSHTCLYDISCSCSKLLDVDTLYPSPPPPFKKRENFVTQNFSERIESRCVTADYTSSCYRGFAQNVHVMIYTGGAYKLQKRRKRNRIFSYSSSVYVSSV